MLVRISGPHVGLGGRQHRRVARPPRLTTFAALLDPCFLFGRAPQSREHMFGARCRECSRRPSHSFKRSHLVALRTNKILAAFGRRSWICTAYRILRAWPGSVRHPASGTKPIGKQKPQTPADQIERRKTHGEGNEPARSFLKQVGCVAGRKTKALAQFSSLR